MIEIERKPRRMPYKKTIVDTSCPGEAERFNRMAATDEGAARKNDNRGSNLPPLLSFGVMTFNFSQRLAKLPLYLSHKHI